MRIAFYVLVVLYALCGLAALGLIVASDRGMFGMEPDPLAAVFAIILALPWSLVLQLLPSTGPVLGMSVLAAFMALNVALGLWLARRFGDDQDRG